MRNPAGDIGGTSTPPAFFDARGLVAERACFGIAGPVWQGRVILNEKTALFGAGRRAAQE